MQSILEVTLGSEQPRTEQKKDGQAATAEQGKEAQATSADQVVIDAAVPTVPRVIIIS